MGLYDFHFIRVQRILFNLVIHELWAYQYMWASHWCVYYSHERAQRILFNHVIHEPWSYHQMWVSHGSVWFSALESSDVNKSKLTPGCVIRRKARVRPNNCRCFCFSIKNISFIFNVYYIPLWGPDVHKSNKTPGCDKLGFDQISAFFLTFEKYFLYSVQYP